MPPQDPTDEPSRHLTLSAPEALVLFELLSRRAGGNDPLLIEHAAERVVLSSLLCQLESALVEPFRADYDALLAAARELVAEGHADS